MKNSSKTNIPLSFYYKKENEEMLLSGVDIKPKVVLKDKYFKEFNPEDKEKKEY